MNHITKEYLYSVLDIDTLRPIGKLWNLITENIVDFEVDVLEQYLPGLSYSGSEEGNIIGLRGHITSLAVELASYYGVRLHGSLREREYIPIIETLTTINEREDIDEYRDIMESSASAYIRFCELVSKMTGTPVTFLFDVVISVNEELFSELLELLDPIEVERDLTQLFDMIDKRYSATLASNLYKRGISTGLNENFYEQFRTDSMRKNTTYDIITMAILLHDGKDIQINTIQLLEKRLSHLPDAKYRAIYDDVNDVLDIIVKLGERF